MTVVQHQEDHSRVCDGLPTKATCPVNLVVDLTVRTVDLIDTLGLT
jgi:hypothetical protein